MDEHVTDTFSRYWLCKRLVMRIEIVGFEANGYDPFDRFDAVTRR